MISRIKSYPIIKTFAAALAFVAFAAFGKGSAPVGLLVNGVSNPLAIDRNDTRFTWMLNDNARHEMQTAYEIVVYSNSPISDFRSLTSAFWDSGKVASAQSASVEYTGPALPATTRFWWKIRIWDQTGQPGVFSDPAFFDTGLNQDEWTAQYVWDGTTNKNNFAYFRKTFVITKRPSLAKVYVTAHNDYLLYCNGQLLGRGPARCDPYHYGQYNAYDVTKLLKPGTNVIAGMAHWLGIWRDSGVNGQPAFLLEGKFQFDDGSSLKITSDGSWKALAKTGFIETNAVYFGSPGTLNRAAIKFDSRRDPVGWKMVGFDDSQWVSATVVDRPNYHLFAQMAPLEREQAKLRPMSITLTNGAWLVDFGHCIDGWPKLTMRANPPGSVVRVQYFEMAGERYSAGWDEYICRGGKETWDADFGRHTSFQVLKITGYAGKLRTSDVRGIWAYCDADVAGRFHCSSQLLNAIYTMCERSARQNIQQGIISVDAQREQSPWTADSWNIGNVLLYNDRNTMMIDKVVRDYAAEQMPDGSIRDCSPSDVTWVCAEWSMYWPMLLWQQYLFSGDQTLLREMAPLLAHSLAWLETFQDPATKLINPRAGRISEWAGGNMPNGGYNVATACQYYENLVIASRIFSMLNDPTQSDDYLQQADGVKAGINSNLFNGEFYRARTDTNLMFPLASAWALRFNIEPAAARAKTLATILAPGKLNLGGYGGDAFYSGVLNAGGGAFVVDDLARYRPMLNSNQACWESFDPGHGEVNHAWTAYPSYIFLKYICGIQPTSGGFATFDVRPETDGLTFAEGCVPTVKGLITTSWRKEVNGQFSLSVHVPANSQAAIYIPKLANKDFIITDSAKCLWPARSVMDDPGVLAVSEADPCVKCLVGGGDYEFHEIPTNLDKYDF